MHGKGLAMGKTYLLNKPQKDGTTALSTATKEEWIAAVKGNKNLPTEQRRYFIVDCIEEGNDIDRMIIEVSYDEYRRWNSRHTISERNRKEGKKFHHLSLDAVLNESDGIELLECVGGIEDIDAAAMDEILMKELKRKLAAWKPWATDMLEIYLAGNKRTCSAAMAAKYGVSEQVIRKYKRQFEEFIKNFFTGVSF